MRLRDATSDDLPAIHAQNEAAVPAVSAISLADFTWFLEVASHFRVAEVDGALAGFMIALRPGLDYTSMNYAWFSARYDDFYYIDRLAVDPAFRRRGVASALYDDIEQRAIEAGAPLLACEVNLHPRNEESLAFHAARGFHEVGRQDTEGGTKTVALMTMPLATASGPA